MTIILRLVENNRHSTENSFLFCLAFVLCRGLMATAWLESEFENPKSEIASVSQRGPGGDSDDGEREFEGGFPLFLIRPPKDLIHLSRPIRVGDAAFLMGPKPQIQPAFLRVIDVTMQDEGIDARIHSGLAIRIGVGRRLPQFARRAIGAMKALL